MTGLAGSGCFLPFCLGGSATGIVTTRWGVPFGADFDAIGLTATRIGGVDCSFGDAALGGACALAFFTSTAGAGAGAGVGAGAAGLVARMTAGFAVPLAGRATGGCFAGAAGVGSTTTTSPAAFDCRATTGAAGAGAGAAAARKQPQRIVTHRASRP